ncbi:MAG: AAA family ATPase [Rhodocyclaceae bacterium]|nr:AAA family ATPase [Rhodocyclaceae bacterium]
MKENKSQEPKVLAREFHAKRVAHLKLKEVFDRLSWIVEQEPENVEDIVLLVGPSGCGKSTLMKRLEADIHSKYLADMESDPGFVPVIYSRLTAPQDGNFNWKDFFSRLLEAFNDILIRKKVILHPEAMLDGEIIVSIRALVREELRRAVRNAFAFRRTKFLLLDEAGHLLLTKSSLPARVQFELIKSVAQELHIPIILAGDYSLLRILELNGQLTRRTEVVHFSRYSVEEMSDPKSEAGQSFRNTVFSLLEALPLQRDDGLVEHMDYFYQFSIGNVGLLKKWLQRALWLALKSEKKVLTRAILESTRIKNKALKLLLDEAILGETTLEDVDDDELTRALGLASTPSIHVITGNFRFTEGNDGPAKAKRRTSKKRPGTRKPGRDPVGGIPRAA